MNIKIAYVTDMHLDETPENLNVTTYKNWETVLNDIAKRGINHIVLGGDMGIADSHQWLFKSLKPYTVDITLGNHDNFNDIIQYYSHDTDSTQSELYYSYELGIYKLIFMDSSAEIISPEQLVWFKKEILTTKSILLFIHHSILPINTEIDKRYALKNRNILKENLLNLKNDVTIFSGHYHFDCKNISGPVCQYITPACSFQVEKIPNKLKINSDSFGYRIIELGDTIKTELISFKST